MTIELFAVEQLKWKEKAEGLQEEQENFEGEKKAGMERDTEKKRKKKMRKKNKAK